MPARVNRSAPCAQCASRQARASESANGRNRRKETVPRGALETRRKEQHRSAQNRGLRRAIATRRGAAAVRDNAPAIDWDGLGVVRGPARTKLKEPEPNVLDKIYDESSAKPTARESGRNSWRPTPTMKNEGTKTARTQSIESKRGIAVLRAASSTALARDPPRARLLCMFSISTVASSTSMPTASANPLIVMMLIVCPASHRITTEPSSAKGMVTITISALRQSRKKEQNHEARSGAAPSSGFG